MFKLNSDICTCQKKSDCEFFKTKKGFCNNPDLVYKDLSVLAVKFLPSCLLEPINSL